jgi:hypothetical protein
LAKFKQTPDRQEQPSQRYEPKRIRISNAPNTGHSYPQIFQSAKDRQNCGYDKKPRMGSLSFEHFHDVFSDRGAAN